MQGGLRGELWRVGAGLWGDPVMPLMLWLALVLVLVMMVLGLWGLGLCLVLLLVLLMSNFHYDRQNGVPAVIKRK